MDSTKSQYATCLSRGKAFAYLEAENSKSWLADIPTLHLMPDFSAVSGHPNYVSNVYNCNTQKGHQSLVQLITVSSFLLCPYRKWPYSQFLTFEMPTKQIQIKDWEEWNISCNITSDYEKHGELMNLWALWTCQCPIILDKMICKPFVFGFSVGFPIVSRSVKDHCCVKNRITDIYTI